MLSHSNQPKAEKEESSARDKRVGFSSVELSSYRLLPFSELLLDGNYTLFLVAIPLLLLNSVLSNG